MNAIGNYKITIIGGLLGAIAGYAYYHFIGCSGGSCPITSSPYISTLYGAVLGSILTRTRKNQNQ